ncbi:MAG: Hvo_1808 family surface protein [Halovenus sp.]
MQRGRILRLALVASLVVLAGCTGAFAPTDSDSDDLALDDDLGTVEGVAHDDELDISADDGFNGTERELLVTRAMARIEAIRGLPFERDVDVEVISRAEYRRSRSDGSTDETHAAWNNQVWRAKFLVGADRDIETVFNETLGAAVLGFYDVGEDRIVLVSDADEPTISKETLVHELVHALQDQHFGLDDRPETQDAQLARRGVVEGEAELVPDLYFERCGEEWSCIRPPTPASSGSDTANIGVLRVLSHPYTSGPDFVATIRDRGGWAAVDDLYRNLPVSTTQILHPEKYPDERPVNVTVPDRSSSAWSRFDHDPVGERVGEASLYVMFRDNDLIQPEGDDPYSHPATEGWRGDKLVPYRRGDDFGYVWELEWHSPDDAAVFAEHYRDLLDTHDAVERGTDAFLIPDGPFAGAYRVSQEGTTVRIVNGPTVAALSAIH